MIHSLYFITRKPTISDAGVSPLLCESSGPIAKRISQLKRYEQSHRIPFAGSNSSYDGAAEVWLEHEAALAAVRKSPAYLNGALADELNFIDMSRVEWLVTKDHVILDGPQTPHQVKSIFLLKRQSGMSLG